MINVEPILNAVVWWYSNPFDDGIENTILFSGAVRGYYVCNSSLTLVIEHTGSHQLQCVTAESVYLQEPPPLTKAKK